MLAKNPAGFNQLLSFLQNIPDKFVLVLCLNDRGADGTDISWIWDANFEELCNLAGTLEKVIVSGDRAGYFGNGTDMFGIYIINGLLSFITCGIYYPWAICRMNRYIYSNVHIIRRGYSTCCSERIGTDANRGRPKSVSLSVKQMVFT